MLHQQLVDYIRQQIQQGVRMEDIKRVLLEQKWNEADVDESFRRATMSSLETAPNPPNPSLLSATKTFGQAWKLFTERIGTLVGITLLSFLFVIALVVIGGVVAFAAGISLFTLPEFVLGNIVLTIVLAILVSLIFSILSIWGQAAVMYAVKDAHEKIGVIESYRRAWHVLLPYWWVLLLSSLVMVGGLFLFIIPAILLGVWFSLAGFVLISEREKGLRALFKSREYVRGNWWAVFWNFIFLGLVYLFISLGLWLLGLLPIPDIILGILNFILQILLPSLSAAYVFFVYQNLKAVKGDVVAVVSGGTKAWFIGLCLLPFLAALLLMPFMMKMSQFLKNPMLFEQDVTSLEEDGFSSLGSAQMKARDAKRLSDIKQIQVALELFYTDHAAYPVGSSIFLGDPEHLCLNGDGFGGVGCAQPYMGFIPTGPEVGEYYLYASDDGSTYTIVTDLIVGAGGLEPGTIAATPEGITNF
ncbi:MAG: hypothetical protein KBD29_00675 [Candidatus Magasanikbacteria bacterium]|nr:hypothetical protein [Candidatus Magasanikbacteria bacterium]